MKVYVVIANYDCEGRGEPEGVFSTKEGAVALQEKQNKLHGSDYREVLEYDLEQVVPKSLHWLGDKIIAGLAADTTGCVMYFDSQDQCLAFMAWYHGARDNIEEKAMASDTAVDWTIERWNAVDWAVEQWNAEVANRPLRNVHRRALDTTWRKVIRHFGGDHIALCGPTHDELVTSGGSYE